MDEFGPTYSKVTLDRLTFGFQQMISEELAEDFAINAEYSVEHNYLFRTIALRIRQDVLAQHLDRATVRYPATWWEGVKESLYRWCSYAGGGHWPWFSDYAATRWPVVYRTITIDVKALYPRIAMPGGYITVLRQET